ncbi:MAG: hypothetical protein U0457_14830 [Candidatus Sericytochromatia bacterium]
MSNKTSHHILNTSTNLLGFCLFVITALHVTDKSKETFIDEFSILIAILLSTSSLLSFFSIIIEKEKLSKKLEKTADYIFIFSLSGILIIMLITAFNMFRGNLK